MKSTLLLLSAAIALAGCDDRPQGRAPHGPGEGRYLGLGIYQPDSLWKQLAGVVPPADSKAATLADDSEIIVVVDSRTGEVRQCGNMSGHCIAMNPWGPPAAASGVVLNKHGANANDAVETRVEAPAKTQP